MEPVEPQVAEKDKPHEYNPPPERRPPRHRCPDQLAPCGWEDVPELQRLRYFYGQMLRPNDFVSEQAFFREKLRIHNRCLHGYGVVCGLELLPIEPEKPCDTKDQCEQWQQELDQLSQQQPDPNQEKEKQRQARIEALRRKLRGYRPADPANFKGISMLRLNCGFALDCEGNEIIVRRPREIDVWDALTAKERALLEREKRDVWVSICFCEMPVDHVRPVLPDGCGGSNGCAFGKVQDSYRIVVTLEAPHVDDRCETCCAPCKCDRECDDHGHRCNCKCLLLARIPGFTRGQTITWVDNSVRRMLSTYPPTVITGVSWKHGASYGRGQVEAILGTRDHLDEPKGLLIEFSRPVLTETLLRGVVDLWVIEGGEGRSADIHHLKGDFTHDTFYDSNGNRKQTTTYLRYQQTSDESLEHDDQLLIIMRADFILDECCQPVDGNHVGGRVPLLAEFDQNDAKEPQYERCLCPPRRPGPWTSGSGTPGGTFESWFFVNEPGAHKRRGDQQQQARERGGER